MKWRIIAVIASIIPLIIIALLLDVAPEDIFAVGIVPFLLASLAGFAKLVVQGVRFSHYLRSFVGRVGSIGKNIEIRMGSEFVTLTTPAYTGGEFVRVAWLYKKGVHSGKGMWIVTTEVISDVLVGSILAFMAAFLAFISENYLIATSIVVITAPIFTAYMTLLILSSKRILQMPRFTLPLLTRFVGSAKGEKWTNTMNDAVKVLCESARENLYRSSSIKIFAVGLALTFLGASLHGLTFMLIANTTATLGFFESLMSVAASVAIGTLPVSPGGSGLSEVGIGYYLVTFGMDPTTFGSVIIAWRVASYHIPLLISWIALMMTTVKVKKGKPT
ncbi:MAG: YbhN family protein [Nitrososphaerales archaeon]